MRKRKEKQIAMILATGLIASNFPGTLTYAKTNIMDNNIKTYNTISVDGDTFEVVYTLTLSNGKNIRALKDSSNNIILQELDSTGDWINKDTIGKVMIKEMEENADGSYTVIYLVNDFKYKQVYNNDSVKIGNEEICGLEIETHENNILTLDFVVDKENNKTILKTLSGDVVVNEFIPTLNTYIGSRQIVIFGEDSKKETSILIVTENGKVINGDLIKSEKYMSPEYSEIKSLGISELDDEKFLISGYGIKAADPNKKDGFLIQFDGNGNRDSEVKIIPSSHSPSNDASINYLWKFESGNILIKGDNLPKMYINDLNYIDNRPVKESLSITNGKTYRIVEETNMSRAVSNNLKTFTVKGMNDIFEYDINTYSNVQDIKLVPGNENQIIIAVQKDDASTEVDIINTNDDVQTDFDGDVIGKVVNTGKIQSNNTPVLNIDLKNIKVNSNGNIIVTTDNNSTPIEVTINDVQGGKPIEVTPSTDNKPEIVPPTENKPEVVPPVENKPEVVPPIENKPEVVPPAENKPEVVPSIENKPEVIPPIENTPVVNIDKGEVIVYDINKPTNIKVVSSKLENKDVEYIIVNGIKVTKNRIEGKLARNASKEYFTTSKGSITLTSKLFEELNLDVKGGYIIGVGFTDGTEIADLATLKVVNTNNIATKPSADNKEEINIVEENNKLPNTGVAATSTVPLFITTISSLVATVLFRKKK